MRRARGRIGEGKAQPSRCVRGKSKLDVHPLWYSMVLILRVDIRRKREAYERYLTMRSSIFLIPINDCANFSSHPPKTYCQGSYRIPGG